MNIFQFFIRRDPLKRKIIAIKNDIKKIVTPYCSENFWIEWYGAYDIDPKHLVFWICVESDLMKKELKSNDELMIKLKDLFLLHDYPKEAIDNVIIDFESKETVGRESNGNWYHHFK